MSLLLTSETASPSGQEAIPLLYIRTSISSHLCGFFSISWAWQLALCTTAELWKDKWLNISLCWQRAKFILQCNQRCSWHWDNCGCFFTSCGLALPWNSQIPCRLLHSLWNNLGNRALIAFFVNTRKSNYHSVTVPIYTVRCGGGDNVPLLRIAFKYIHHAFISFVYSVEGPCMLAVV